MRVGIFDLNEYERGILKKLLKKKGIEAELFEKPYEGESFEIVSIFVDSPILKPPKSLKHLITMSTGFDHINLNECKKNGTLVYNVPDYGTTTVAEFTLLLMLASLRKLPLAIEQVKTSQVIDYEVLRGRDLFGKTVGVVGTGRIGFRVAELCLSMGCNVVAYNRSIKDRLAKKGVRFVEFEELLRISDIITFHLPLTEKTRHILNRNNMGLLKKNAIVINTARGALIETDALLERSIFGGFDTIEGESLLKREVDVLKKELSAKDLKNRIEVDLLLKDHSFIITPHIAYNTEEAIFRILNTTVDTIDTILKGREPNNRVV